MKRIIGLGLLVVVAAGCAKRMPPPEREAVVERPLIQQVRADAPEEAPQRAPDVIFVPTPEERVQAMLRLARVGPQDIVYDLGCGDGRIAIAAARDYGARAVCIDIDPQRVREARENARRAGVEDRVEVRQADLFETDLSAATVVTLYLLPSLNQKLRPKLLRELRPGSRIVSHSFDMGDWRPEAKEEVSGESIYLWLVRG